MSVAGVASLGGAAASDFRYNSCDSCVHNREPHLGRHTCVNVPAVPNWEPSTPMK